MSEEVKSESSRNQQDIHEDESQISIISQKECGLIEGQIGFKPNASNNYYCSIYYRDTKNRDVMFDGAVPLDQFVQNSLDFFRHYAQYGNQRTDYYMTVLLTDKSYKNIVFLSGKSSNKVRLFMIRKILPVFYHTMDTLFKVFIQDGNKKFYKYREDTPFNYLSDAYQLYISTVKKQLDELILPVANETEESIRESINVAQTTNSTPNKTKLNKKY